MIVSNYLRSVCCGLFMLAIAQRACAVTIPWWSIPASLFTTSFVSSVAGAFVFKLFDKKKPVRVSYPDQELYRIDANLLKDASWMKIRREKGKLANLVEFVRELDKNFVACVNERSLAVGVMQETLKDEIDSAAIDGDIEDLKSLAKEHIDTIDGDKKAELFITTYREMKEQARKVKNLLEEYEEQHSFG